MPDSRVKVIEDHLENELDKAETALETFRSIINALPHSCPEPASFSPSGYCAQAMLGFKDPESLYVLLKALPAERVVWLRESLGSTLKPFAALRPTEQSADWLTVYPLILKAPYGHDLGPDTLLTTRWWTTLGRVQTEIVVEDVPRRVFEALLETHYRIQLPKSFGYLPKPLKPRGKLSALAAWRRHLREGVSREAAHAEELAEVEMLHKYLTERIFSLGYYTNGTEHASLYQEFIENVLVRDTGLQAHVDIFSDNFFSARNTVTVRVSLDPEYRNESFYDLEIVQNTARRLLLKDIPVEYPETR